MRIQLLGPVTAFTDDGATLRVGGVRLRMLLAKLALAPGQTVSAAALIDGLWGGQPPTRAHNALQALVSRLRKALADTALVESTHGGYRLAVPAEAVDAQRFEVLAERGRRLLAQHRDAEAADELSAALGLWHGEALLDVRVAPFAGPAAQRLARLRLDTIEDHAAALSRLARHAEVLAVLATASAEHPLRERGTALRNQARLAIAGRTGTASPAASGRPPSGLIGTEPGWNPPTDGGGAAGRLDSEHGRNPRTGDGAAGRSGAGPGQNPPPGGTGRPAAAQPPSGGGETALASRRLPLRLTSFIGRETELDQLATRLADSRLVTVVGTGGAGKTRLAIEAVSRHPALAAERAWFTPLAEVGSDEDLTEAILTDLDVSAAGRTSALRPARSAGAVERIIELLAGDTALLVLDNCEHLLPACAKLARQLLDRLPRLTILATSREPLGLTGEALCPLGPLPVPATTEAAETAAAVRLFADRAAAVRPGFTVTKSNIDKIVEVCRRLDGLPLALELAAVRLRAMSLDQIAGRLDDRFRLLRAGSRAALPRQRTLQAVIAWSWDLLTDPERRLARRLSLFTGGASPAAVAAVCGADLAGDDPERLLGSLADKSIVDVTAGPEPRYRMLESVRAFAADRLDAAAERADAEDRFRRHFLAVAQRQEPRLRTHDQIAATAILDTEHANLVAALRSAIDTRDSGTAHRLLSAVLYHWSIHSVESRLDAHLAQVLQFGDALPTEVRAAFELFRLIGRDDFAAVDAHVVRRAIEECLRTEAMRHYPMLRVATMAVALTHGFDDLWKPVLDSARIDPDGWVRAATAWVETYIRVDRGDWDGARTARRRALDEFTEVGDRLGLASVLADSGKAASIMGDHAAAVGLLERAVAVSAARGWEDEISHRTMLAIEHRRGGDAEAAWAAIAAALRRARDRGHRNGEVEVLQGYAELHRRAGELDRAEEYLAATRQLIARLSQPAAFADAMTARTVLAIRLDRGATASARELLPTALSAAKAMLDLASAAELLARLRFAEDEPDAAARALGWSRAVRGAFDRGDPELAALVAELRDRLGEDGYRRAFDAAAAVPNAEAVAALTAAAG